MSVHVLSWTDTWFWVFPYSCLYLPWGFCWFFISCGFAGRELLEPQNDKKWNLSKNRSKSFERLLMKWRDKIEVRFSFNSTGPHLTRTNYGGNLGCHYARTLASSRAFGRASQFPVGEKSAGDIQKGGRILSKQNAQPRRVGPIIPYGRS